MKVSAPTDLSSGVLALVLGHAVKEGFLLNAAVKKCWGGVQHGDVCDSDDPSIKTLSTHACFLTCLIVTHCLLLFDPSPSLAH